MFTKRNKQKSLQIDQQEISTVIGAGYIIKGELTGSSVIRIEGKIIGDVYAACGVVLGEDGTIEGNIFTKSAIIHGTVNGNIKATQLEIKSTGIVQGEIITDSLEMELGARYNGKLSMEKEQVLAEAS